MKNVVNGGSMWDKYYTVTSLDEALAILDQEKEKARIIAGGTDLILGTKTGSKERNFKSYRYQSNS